jgi:hypothetical protein
MIGAYPPAFSLSQSPYRAHSRTIVGVYMLPANEKAFLKSQTSEARHLEARSIPVIGLRVFSKTEILLGSGHIPVRL